TATPQGEAEFERWLRRPVGRMREVRLDFLIKLHFALDEDSYLARELVAAQIEACEEYAVEIEREQSQVEAATDFDAIVLESKASAAHSTREWLEKCLTSLSSPRGS
ncbi:MAG TPA: hypothetical protein VJB57_16410, partial [Dehalococcoidia bacterium]|nr:hypothetical protein [Dehalococcoidia bacterium]